jgi:hypothetical protein
MRRWAGVRSAVVLVPIASVVLFVAASSGAQDGFVSPSVTTVAVAAGGTVTAGQTVHLDALPPKGDVMIALDTTGSMGAALASAKSEIATIVSRLQSDFAAVPGGAAKFAIAGFQDYPGTVFDSNTNDIAYQLKTTGLTGDPAAVQSAIDSLTLGDGGDSAEAYFLAFYNASTLGWETGAQRFLIVLGDQSGHDPAQQSTFPDCPNSPGAVDPGDGTSGPLPAARVIDLLKQANVKLSFIHYENLISGTDPPVFYPFVPLACHSELASATGGTAVGADAASTLTTQIENLVQAAAQHISSLSVEAANTSVGDPANPSSWVTFSGLPTSVDLPAAGQDLPFTATVKPPANATPGTYNVNVNVIADGTVRATEQLTIVVPLAGLDVSVTPSSVGAGIDEVKIGDIPPAWLAFYAGSITGTPVGSTPVGSTPVGSTPIGSTPVGSTPVGSTPVGSTPIGSTPVGSTPVGSTGLLDIPVGSTPVGSTPVGSTALKSLLLSQIPLCGDVPLPGTTQAQCQTDGATWGAVLASTPFAGQPLNALSLGDVVGNTTVKNRLAALPMKDVSFATTLFKSVRWSSLLLGSKKLLSLPKPYPYSAWCDALSAYGGSCSNVDSNTTVLQMDVGGQLGSTPIGSTPVGSTPVGSTDLAGTPVGSTPVGSTSIGISKLAAIPLSDIVPLADVVNCANVTGGCVGKTLGDAKAGIVPTATFSTPALLAAMEANDITVNDILVAILGPAGFQWESLPVQGLQPYSLTKPHVTYTVGAAVDCSSLESFSFKVTLPPGFFPVSGSAHLSLGSVQQPDPGNPEVLVPPPPPIESATVLATGPSDSYRWSLGCGSVTASTQAQLTFDSYVGLDLGQFTTDVQAFAGGVSMTKSKAAPVTVGQNGEPASDDPGKAKTIDRDTLVVGHLAASGDQDFYRYSLDGLPRGTKISVFLKVPSGADFDLTVSKPATQSFFSSPVGSTPIGSTPIEDTGVGFSTSGQAVPSETLQDIPVGSTPVGSTPVGSTPVGSTSTNRGDVNEVSQIITAGESGVATIGISGYNGSSSDEPYVLRVQKTDPPPLPPTCPARAIAVKSGDQGSLPSSLPASTKSLFLVNKQRLTAIYGKTAVTSLLNSLNTLVSRSEVAGSVLSVDGNAAVRNAYAAWDSNPCDVNRANNIVRAINDVVASYRNAGLPNLHYIVLLGNDEAIPMARTPDPVTLSPELNEAADLAFTTSGLMKGNALYTSAAQNNILTDGAYGAFTSIPWLGHDLLLPQISVSRLVETPTDMSAVIDQYTATNGTLSVASAFTSGYDFLADGADAVATNLATRFSLTGTNSSKLINDSWTNTDLSNGFFAKSPVPSIGSLNAHYNHYELQPAAGTPLVTTSALPSSIPGRILFTMGCHGGLNVSDALGGDAAKLSDWVQASLKAKVATYIANTGFGYGDSASVALSERLLALFANNLHSDSNSVGEEWLATVQQYFATAGAYDVYDEKVLQETTFFGLPFWHFTGNVTSPSPVSLPTTIDQVTGAQSATVFFPGTGAITQDQFGLYRPILPLKSQEITSTLPARGVWIGNPSTSPPLVTDDGTADVSAKIGMPTIDLAAHERKPNLSPIFFPASPFSLAHSNVFGRQRDYVNVSDQFRPTSAGMGRQRHIVSATLKILYSNSTDLVPPLISQVHVSLTGGIEARVTDDSGAVVDVAALVNDGTWHYVPLTPSAGDPTLFVGTTGGGVNSEVFVEATDGSNVSYSANKGSNFTSTNSGTGTGPQILILAPAGTYQLNQAVNASFQCLGGVPAVEECRGTASNGSAIDTTTAGLHTFVVTAFDAQGNVLGSLQRRYLVWSFGGFLPPIANPPNLNTVKAGSSVPIKFSLGGNQGLQIFARGYPQSQMIDCVTEAPPSGTSTVPSGQSSLNYTASTDQYTYSWKTDPAWAGTCRQLIVRFRDGLDHIALFKLTK